MAAATAIGAFHWLRWSMDEGSGGDLRTHILTVDAQQLDDLGHSVSQRNLASDFLSFELPGFDLFCPFPHECRLKD